ncbi:MAG: hypothetical protein ACREYC_14990 [Gammaproteobacteria bacterium]
MPISCSFGGKADKPHFACLEQREIGGFAKFVSIFHEAEENRGSKTARIFIFRHAYIVWTPND